MIRHLQVSNYVLIDSLEIDFPESLVIITGQTGAGKSILLGALSLLTGAKADASVISEGAESCVVEAEFSLSDPDGSIRQMLDENDVEWCDGNLLVRRVVHSSGRSRSFVNDSPVNIGVLAELSSHLVDIHSQHQSLLLQNKTWQLSALDHFAGNVSLLQECRSLWDKKQSLSRELESARERLAKLNSESDYATAQFRQLSEALLKEGELEELEEEQTRLANAEEIKTNLGEAAEYLNSSSEVGMPVSQALKEAQKILERTSRFIPQLSELASRLESVRIETDDILDEIQSHDSSVSLSEDRLSQVEERMSLLYTLMKKHSCANVAELISVRDSYESALNDTSALEIKIDNLSRELDQAAKAYAEVCSRLHQARLGAASEFASRIQSQLRFLELDRASFEVDVNEARESASGSDSVLFRFSSNGTPAVDVAKCASGGEISRIMLCLKAMMAHFTHMPTMIFDEIDTGVSGSVADKMGTMICSMGQDMQVMAITHLPQVAAKGTHHFVVEKSMESDGKVKSRIRRLTDDERVGEIARLLSGATISDAALMNARELLS